MILLVADMEEIDANPDAQATGVVLEALDGAIAGINLQETAVEVVPEEEIRT